MGALPKGKPISVFRLLVRVPAAASTRLLEHDDLCSGDLAEMCRRHRPRSWLLTPKFTLCR